jgi:4'-phosphopantetheinyl transferase
MINVHWVPVPNEKTLSESFWKLADTILDDLEKQTFHRYRVSFKRAEFLLGRILIKTLLASKVKLNPREILLSKNIFGKPFQQSVDGLPDYQFNLSHSSGLVVCGVSHHPIGVDVEKVDDLPLEVMKKVFSKEETNFVLHQPTIELKMWAFYLIWTRKEALMKANGHGFHRDPRLLSIPLDSLEEKNSEYGFASKIVLNDYLCSIVVPHFESFSEHIHFHKIELDELIEHCIYLSDIPSKTRSV